MTYLLELMEAKDRIIVEQYNELILREHSTVSLENERLQRHVRELEEQIEQKNQQLAMKDW